MSARPMSESELAALRAVDSARLAAVQSELDLGLAGVANRGSLPITSQQMDSPPGCVVHDLPGGGI